MFELPPREILSMLHHPFSHDLHLSTRVHTIHSIQSRVHTIHCTRMRAGVELCHSPPRRFSQPVVHNQESPLVSYASYVCVRVAGLYSTRGILKLDSRSQGKRRRTEEKAHSLPPESHILLNYEMGIYTDSCRLPWMNVGLFQVQIFLASV